MNTKLDSFRVSLQRLLPQHLLSRLAGKLTDARQPWLKNFLIHLSIRRFNIDLSDALEPDPEAYNCFNDFFTRALRPDARPIATDYAVSPADGVLSQAGKIDGGRIIQAKGRDFDVATLLGEPNEQRPKDAGQPFQDGLFATIYLSPRDYHRVHMPLAGILRKTRYIPGKLFSVNAVTTQHLDQLFATNERLVCWFETEVGDMVLILVGAMLVAGIESVWHGHYSPGTSADELFDGDNNVDGDNKGLQLAKGEEMGRFKFGSTAIVLLPPGADLAAEVEAGQFITMGSAVAKIDGCT
ncbi:MAG: phosphatidylserine decarboxylase [Porticoccaceae bacterium]|nr:phosphatidylserine decarboxylase [Porticoccaceae bacterium]